jgi:hypothetical protein
MPQVRKYRSDAERQAAYRKRQDQARERSLEANGLPSLPKVPTLPGAARWKAAIAAARSLLERVSEEMEDYYQDRSESWRESERGERFGERLEEIQDVLEGLRGLED